MAQRAHLNVDLYHTVSHLLACAVGVLRMAWLCGFQKRPRKSCSVFMSAKSAAKRPISSLCKVLASLGRGQKVDRVDDRHRDDIFLGAEVERQHAFYDLAGQFRCIHVR